MENLNPPTLHSAAKPDILLQVPQAQQPDADTVFQHKQHFTALQPPQPGPSTQGRASPPAARCSLTRISMVPLEIFVVMPKAWKKEVFSGPRPVFCAGTVTSQGAIAPARAAAGTWRKGKEQLRKCSPTRSHRMAAAPSRSVHSSRMDVTRAHTSDTEAEPEPFV